MKKEILIEILGSASEVARLAGVSRQAVFRWKDVPEERLEILRRSVESQIEYWKTVQYGIEQEISYEKRKFKFID